MSSQHANRMLIRDGVIDSHSVEMALLVQYVHDDQDASSELD